MARDRRIILATEDIIVLRARCRKCDKDVSVDPSS